MGSMISVHDVTNKTSSLGESHYAAMWSYDRSLVTHIHGRSYNFDLIKISPEKQIWELIPTLGEKSLYIVERILHIFHHSDAAFLLITLNMHFSSLVFRSMSNIYDGALLRKYLWSNIFAKNLHHRCLTPLFTYWVYSWPWMNVTCFF